MKITELKGVKHTPIYSAAKRIYKKKQNNGSMPSVNLINFSNELTKMGWNKFSGAYGIVFIRDDFPYVIKVFNNDPAYFKYLNWVLQHQSNPFVPKIRGKFIKINQYTYAVRMEKLSHLSDTNIRELDKYVDPELNKKTKIDISKWRNVSKLALSANLPYIKEIEPQLYEVLEYVVKNFTLKSLDLHGDNIMLRGDVIVITDPVATD